MPTPSRLEADRTKPKGYRVVAVSLYTPEADWIDHAATALRMGGNLKANRSLVVREAILRLQEELDSRAPNEIQSNFTQHQARRSQGLPIRGSA